MFKLVRHVKDQDFTRQDGRPGKLRQFSIKDIHGNRNRFTIWDSFRNMDGFSTGQVLQVTNLQTSVLPKDGPPFYLQTTFRTVVKEAPQETYAAFEKIDDSDAT